MLPSNFITFVVFITIFFANPSSGIMCYRGPMNFESSSFLKELVKTDCSKLIKNTESTFSVCLLALKCNVKPFHEEYHNLAAKGVRKIYEAKCVEEITLFGPYGIRYTIDDMCVKYYKGERGCESCITCDTDFCNKFTFPSSEAVIYANGTNTTWNNADDKNASDDYENNASDGTLYPISFFMFFILNLVIFYMAECYLA